MSVVPLAMFGINFGDFQMKKQPGFWYQFANVKVVSAARRAHSSSAPFQDIAGVKAQGQRLIFAT